MGHASTLFCGNVEQTLIKRVTPTADQREFLQVQWNALADHLKAQLAARHGYPVSTWLQGSYKFGTLIKPVHVGEEYDVDVGVYFEWVRDGGAEPTARQLRDWVQNELAAYAEGCEELKEVEDPKERCSRASYERQFHIDTPTYHLDPDKDRRRLACLSDKWEESDPKAIYKWFRDQVSDDSEQLRRLVRYMKAWAALSFDDVPEGRPSSIVLTVLVTQAFAGMGLRRFFGIEDDDALIAVVKELHQRLSADRSVPNPVDEAEDLNRMSDEGWDAFMPRLTALLDVAERAEAAESEEGAALIWAEAFSFLMPLPEADIETLDEGTGRAVMPLPEIDIEIYSREPRRLLARHRNEVSSVVKGCNLLFRIANPHVVPQFATVEWTVRNEGDEADALSDLGHRRLGVRMLEAEEERAEYRGRHFMDCIVRLNGSVYAMRRVPVSIRDLQMPARNPPRPAYTQLRKFLKRR